MGDRKRSDTVSEWDITADIQEIGQTGRRDGERVNPLAGRGKRRSRRTEKAPGVEKRGPLRPSTGALPSSKPSQRTFHPLLISLADRFPSSQYYPEWPVLPIYCQYVALAIIL
jgi:hypothetical protein